MLRRVPPIAAALALVAAALIAAAWTTRSTVIDAYDAVRDGQAVTLQQAVRADLADLGGPPTADDLAQILHEHSEDGLRYLATVERGGQIGVSAGTPVGAPSPARLERGAPHFEMIDGRIRIETRAMFRRAWGSGARPAGVVLEIEAVKAEELGEAATRSLAIGLIAAVVLLGVAVGLVRRELRRRSEARERERQKRLASLGEMSAVLAHEIKNPLASLKGNAQLLVAMLPAGEKPRAKAERVVDEAVRLEKLTQGLLTFVRTGEIARAPVEPASLVRDAVASFEGVEIDVGAAPATFPLDAARMREVIINLVDNAIAAGPPARVTVRGDGTQLVLEVIDHGPGVPAEDRERIFEPFHTGKTHGTGLGLAIVQRVVELNHGTIAVDDAPGGGARFTVVVPEA